MPVFKTLGDFIGQGSPAAAVSRAFSWCHSGIGCNRLTELEAAVGCYVRPGLGEPVAAAGSVHPPKRFCAEVLCACASAHKQTGSNGF